MSDIMHLPHLDRSGLPSSRSLIKATAIALVVAAVLLATIVLPAEYGMDPTGLGTRLGLTAMSAELPAEEVIPQSAAAGPAPTMADPVSALTAVWKSQTPHRSDEMSLTLQPSERAEIKAKMRSGERFVFTWAVADGVVNFDMHGEAFNANNGEFTSYWKGNAQSNGQGVFVAPFDGTHGWYWRNRGKAPVTVRVQTTGFYEQLFRP